MQAARFGIVDYVLFVGTLLLSAMIGIYFGCFGSKQKSASEYLYGNRNMKAIPVGLSLYSSAVSAIAIIGTPSEVYVFGTQFLMVIFGSLLSLVITWNLVLPVFCTDLGLKMPYEYFELRFDTRVRIMSSLIYILHVFIYMPVVLYASTLAFSELSGIPLLICTTAVGGVCVLYTMVGGFNSVIWTDTLQATLMLVSCFVVTIVGINKVGGINNIWEISEKGGRIQFFNMDLNPFTRLTFWSTVIGMAFNFASHSGCSASTLQRYMALSTQKDAKISSFIGSMGFSLITIITGTMGLSMYALYSGCDPEKNKNIDNSNQLVPYFISDTVSHIPGFSGFFIAGLLSAGLSTISAEFNTVSGLLYHDFIKKFYKKPLSEKTGAIIMKGIVLLNGILCLALVPVLLRSKHIFQFSLMLCGLTYGAKLGAVILGTTFPKVNSQGALWGMITSILFIAWVSFGAFYYNVNARYILPTSVEKCASQNNSIINETLNVQTMKPTNDSFFLYSLSYMNYPLFGLLSCLIVGNIVSYFTRSKNNKKIDPRLIVRFMQSYIPAHLDNKNTQTLLINEQDTK